jgi:hypothetical protein
MPGTQVAPGVIFVKRTEFGFPATVFKTGGVIPRPALELPAASVAWHYTGNLSPLSTADMAAVVQAMKNLESQAIANDKSNEYNYAIFALADGTGVIAEYAGRFMAAHSTGNNHNSIGCLFYLGCTRADAQGHPLAFQAMPDPMVRAYRVLRDVVLTGQRMIDAHTAQVFHKNLPGASTVCPGDGVASRRSDLLARPAGPIPSPHSSISHPALNHDTEVIVNALPDVVPGSQGDPVKRVQGLLLAAGFAPGTIDGSYTTRPNSPTRAAILAFQRAHGLDQDGKVQIHETWPALLGV